MSSEQERLMSAALEAADRGWHVFPLRPGDKRPAIRDWQARATIDSRRIAMCWRMGPYNIGIACGPSGLVVVDLDKDKTRGEQGDDGQRAFHRLARSAGGGVAWWQTLTVRSPSGGMHLYFQAPADCSLRNTAGRLAPLVDTRAEGGYIVAPGSSIGGRRYTVTADRPVVELPGPLVKALLPRADEATGEVIQLQGEPMRYTESAIRGELSRIADARVGTRNTTLNSAAFALGRLVGAGLLSEDVARNALRGAGLAVGLGASETKSTVRSGLEAGTQHPVQVRPRGLGGVR